VACRYRTGRVALGETARLKIVPQVRGKGKGYPLGNRAAVARWPAARITLRQGARVVHESGQRQQKTPLAVTSRRGLFADL
jgi:hypothetical protein